MLRSLVLYDFVSRQTSKLGMREKVMTRESVCGSDIVSVCIENVCVRLELCVCGF